MTDPEITTTTEAPLTKSRLLLASVRALLVVVLVPALGLGWVVRRAQVQQNAVAAIKQTGGEVLYDWQILPGVGNSAARVSGWPKWLIDRLGQDYFNNIKYVKLGKDATDAEMAHVGRLPRLEWAELSNLSKITDAGAAELAGLTNLEYLSLAGSKVTGKALASLKGKPKLTRLFLSELPIHDNDLAQIAGLHNLEDLRLSATEVTDDGLAHLVGMLRLKRLELNSTRIQGPGLSDLGGMAQLQFLYLNKTRVDDLAWIPPFPDLRLLGLDDTPINDKGLANPPVFPAIESLNLRRTEISEVGLERLLAYKRSLRSLAVSSPKLTDASTLSQFENLMTLLLDGMPQLTDATLDQFVTMRGLRTISLDGTGTTPAGLARLKQALPPLMTAKELAAAGQNRNGGRSPLPPRFRGRRP